MHTHMHTLLHILMKIHLDTYAYIHTYIDTHINTFTCTSTHTHSITVYGSNNLWTSKFIALFPVMNGVKTSEMWMWLLSPSLLTSINTATNSAGYLPDVFSTALIASIVRETNRYAHQVLRSEAESKWVDVEPDDTWAFLGLPS